MEIIIIGFAISILPIAQDPRADQRQAERSPDPEQPRAAIALRAAAEEATGDGPGQRAKDADEGRGEGRQVVSDGDDGPGQL